LAADQYFTLRLTVARQRVAVLIDHFDLDAEHRFALLIDDGATLFRR